MGGLILVLMLWNLVEPTWSVNNAEFKVSSFERDWESATKTCLLGNNEYMMPDLGKDVLQSRISHYIQTDEIYWMNAKSVEIMYTGQSVYLKFAYQSTASKLTSYLCHNAKSGETRPLSWQTAQKMCNGSQKWTLYDVSTPKQAKKSVSLLEEDVTYRVDKMSKQKIPSMVSDDYNMREDCIGVMKLQDGTLDYRRDNCTNKHKFFCVFYKTAAEQFAPTITKMSEQFPFVLEDPQSDNISTALNTIRNPPVQESGMSGSELGGTIRGTLVGIILLLVAIGGLSYYLRRRWRSTKDYLRSLHRYTQRQTTPRRLLDKDLNGSLPMGSCYMDNKGSMKITEAEGYEDCEKHSYVEYQKDVLQDLRSCYTKYPYKGTGAEHKKHSSQGASAEQAIYPSHGASTELENLPGYNSMDGKGALQVLPAYETFDPDLRQLQQIHGYVNKDHHPQLSDLEQYDNIPALPEKTGKLSGLDELEQYENHVAGYQETAGEKIVSKPLGDTDSMTVISLDSLEQYENYKVPKREKFEVQGKKATQAAAASKANVKLDSLNDFEDYEGQTTSRRLLDKDLNGSLPMGSCYMDNKGSMKITEAEGYEDCEKHSYVEYQKDVVQDLRSCYTKYPYKGTGAEHKKHSSQGASAERAIYPSHGASTELENLPGHHSMDGEGALRVLPASETFDPDLRQLQQIHGYVNKDHHPQLSDLEQYDNIPALPKKTGKLSGLDELEQYENHVAGYQETAGEKIVSKPLGDTDSMTVISLDSLEQYENYKVPRREKFEVQGKKATQAAAASKANVKLDSLNDFEDYEGYEPSVTTQKKVNKLENLDAYENHTLRY